MHLLITNRDEGVIHLAKDFWSFRVPLPTPIDNFYGLYEVALLSVMWNPPMTHPSTAPFGIVIEVEGLCEPVPFPCAGRQCYLLYALKGHDQPLFPWYVNMPRGYVSTVEVRMTTLEGNLLPTLDMNVLLVLEVRTKK